MLITGASGFLGRLVLEKLLWEAGELVTVIIVLISASGSRKGADRLWKEVFASPVFGRLHTRHGDRGSAPPGRGLGCQA